MTISFSVAHKKSILLINLHVKVHIHDFHFLDRFTQEVYNVFILILYAMDWVR